MVKLLVRHPKLGDGVVVDRIVKEVPPNEVYPLGLQIYLGITWLGTKGSQSYKAEIGPVEYFFHDDENLSFVEFVDPDLADQEAAEANEELIDVLRVKVEAGERITLDDFPEEEEADETEEEEEEEEP